MCSVVGNILAVIGSGTYVSRGFLVPIIVRYWFMLSGTWMQVIGSGRSDEFVRSGCSTR
jgi:hypothetical protein